jgi:Uma2 family endonuclease
MASVLENAAVREAALPISVEQYHQLGEAGIIRQNTELLHGVILENMVKSPEHSWLVQRLVDWLRDGLPSGWLVRQEQPLTFDDSELEPDIAVVKGSSEDFRRQHPRTAALVIEVAISSESIDREKGRIYADAEVSEFWLVLPHLKSIEVQRAPAAGSYQRREVFRAGSTITPAELPVGGLSLSELFEA